MSSIPPRSDMAPLMVKLCNDATPNFECAAEFTQVTAGLPQWTLNGVSVCVFFWKGYPFSWSDPAAESRDRPLSVSWMDRSVWDIVGIQPSGLLHTVCVVVHIVAFCSVFEIHCLKSYFLECWPILGVFLAFFFGKLKCVGLFGPRMPFV